MLLIMSVLGGLAAAFAAPIFASGSDEADEESIGPDDEPKDTGENILDEAFATNDGDAPARLDMPIQDDPSDAADTNAGAEIESDALTDAVGPGDPEDAGLQEAPNDTFIQDNPADLFVQDVLPQGETFGLSAQQGTFELEDFDPRVDIARIEMPDDSAAIQTGLAFDGTPEVYATLSDGSEMTLTFPGLAEVPENAIEFSIPQEDGGEDLVLSLADVIELGGDDPAIEPLEDTISNIFVMGDAPEDLPSDLYDQPVDDLDGLVPVSAGSGDDLDDVTEMLDDLMPVAPGSGDDIDTPTDQVAGGVYPGHGGDVVAPGSGDEEDALISVPLPDGYMPVAPNPA